MPVEWALSIVDPIFKGNGDAKNSSCHRAVKRPEHGMKVVKMVSGKRHCRIVSVDEMQFDFMLQRGTIDAVFILRRLQEGYDAKWKKLYMCFVDLMKSLEASESNDLIVNLGKTIVMVCGGITMDDMFKTKVDPCAVCSLRVRANSVFCVQCGKWIHGRCARLKMVGTKF